MRTQQEKFQMAAEKNRKKSSEPKKREQAETELASTSPYSVSKPTAWENLVMTIKVLAIGGALILLLWLLKRAVSE